MRQLRETDEGRWAGVSWKLMEARVRGFFDHGFVARSQCGLFEVVFNFVERRWAQDQLLERSLLITWEGPVDDDVFYLFLQKQKIGAELHIYLEEGTYHKILCRGCPGNVHRQCGRTTTMCTRLRVRALARHARTGSWR